MSKVVDLGKIKVGKLYITQGNIVVRVVKVNLTLNNVIVYDYHSHTNSSFELDMAEKIFAPAFKLADAARAVGKKPSTIRKYENDGLIPKAKKVSSNPEGRAHMRVYSLEDIEQLRLFFERRRPVGRPVSSSKEYKRKDVKLKLGNIKAKEKFNG